MRLPAPRRIVAAVAFVAAAVLAVTTGTDAVALRGDTRVRVITPTHLQSTTLPATLQWEVTDAELAEHLAAGSAYFVVFVDRPAMPPGSNLAALVDDACVKAADCPTRTWFADRHVYVTAAASLQLATVPQSVPDRQAHQATIVLADGLGRRIGESAWTVRFFVTDA